MKHQIRRMVFTGVMISIAQNAFAAEDETDSLVNIQLEEGLLTEVQTALPESTVANQEFLNTSYDPNLTLQEDAHISITFLDEGAGYRNSLGYFTFTDDAFDGLTFGDIDLDGSGHIGISELQNLSGIETGMIFNNVSETGGGGTLNAGDTVTLGGAEITNIDGTSFDMEGGTVFEAGTNVGFFLLQNAWDGSQVKGWDYTSSDPLTMYTIDFLNPENDSFATIDNADEYSRHVAMMSSLSAEDDIILGFEDLVRPYGDNDFNDAVFSIRTDPVTALYADVPTTETVISLQAAPAPSLGGGSAGLLTALLCFFTLRRKPTKSA
ncbi:DUF4114 domain-containing protein [Neptuniibacter sp. QD37_11]|uniref:DUF4114 domain-containing protein n=1 Tax=Neptuniibacter sp. QD37_11 TaxID=3398209 RepID=UPI0039F4D8A8